MATDTMRIVGYSTLEALNVFEFNECRILFTTLAKEEIEKELDLPFDG